jgi:hypothetical protein
VLDYDSWLDEEYRNSMERQLERGGQSDRPATDDHDGMVPRCGSALHVLSLEF